MAVFDIAGELNPGTWFDYRGGGRVGLRICAGDDLKRIRRQTVKKRIEFKKVDGTPERFEVEEVNEDLQNELLWDFCITGWEDFFDSVHNSIPCNKEMKLLLMGKSIEFSTFVGEKLLALREVEQKREEALEKN